MVTNRGRFWPVLMAVPRLGDSGGYRILTNKDATLAHTVFHEVAVITLTQGATKHKEEGPFVGAVLSAN